MTEHQESNGSHGGIYALLVVIVILLLAGFFWFTSRPSDDGRMEIEVEVPEEVDIGGEGGDGGA